MADIRQRIIASDETSAAYASAKKRVNEYSGAVNASNKEQAVMRTKAANAAEAIGALRGGLNGSTEAMSRVTNAAGKLIPGIAGIAAPIAIGIAAIAALKIAWTEFGMTTRLKSWFTGKPLNEIMSFSEAVKKASDDYHASMQRMKAVRDATFGKQKSKVEMEEADSPITKKAKLARIAYEQEMSGIKDASKDAYQAVREAQDKVDVAVKAGGLIANEEQQKAIREAEAELDRKRKDYAASEDVRRANSTEAVLKYKQALIDVAKASKDADEAVKAGDLAGQIERAGDEAKHVAEYIKMAEDALANVGKSKRLGDVLAGGLGDRGAAKDLKDKQAQLAMIDEQARLIKARTDPGARAQMKAEERDRKRTEGMIKSAEEWQKAGRPLAKWQKDILDEQAVLKFKADQAKQEAAAKAQEQALKEQQAQAAREKQVEILRKIELDLGKTLRAGG